MWFQFNKPNSSNLKTDKMLSKGYIRNLVRVNDLEKEVPCMDSVSIVNMRFGKKGKLSLRYIGHYKI